MRPRARSIPFVGIFAVVLLAAGCRAMPNQRLAINHYVRGRLLAEHGAIDAALGELAEAARQNPTLSVAHAAAGDIYRRRGDYELARRSYERACQANPYAFKPQYHLGLTYQTLARAAKAAAQARKYLRRAIQVYLRAITLEPRDFDTNLNISACYFQLGKYDLAEQYCKAAIAIKADDPHAYSNLGIIFDSQNKLYEAIRAYKASLELDTHQPKLLLNLGSTYMRQDRMKQAIHAFELAIAEAPDDAVPWEQIGSCEYRLGRHDEAIKAYQKAVELDAESATAYRGMGVVYMTQFVMDQSKVELRDRALAAWHSSLELDPAQEDLRRFVRKYSPMYAGPEL